MTMRSLALLVLLSVVGCSSAASDGVPDDTDGPQPVAVACAGLSVGDPNPPSELGTCSGGFALGEGFTPKQVADIRDAGYGWNKFAGRGLVHFGAASNCAIMAGKLPAGQIAEQKDGVITIDVSSLSDADTVFFRYVVMHEIGRALGLTPKSAGPGVMSACSSDPWFSEAELKECRNLGLCY